MNEIRLTVTISRPAQEVFDFALNPENTPKWVDGIVHEQTNETPTKIGTIYKSKNLEKKWSELEITAYEPGGMFIMSKKDGDLHVKYTFKPIDDNLCELEYCVWAEKGELAPPLSEETIRKILHQLKILVERGQNNRS